MNQTRIQLTLFIDAQESENIERIRHTFNPKQYELIKGHVTLCREYELIEIEKVMLNLIQLDTPYLTIKFGKAIRFSNDNGVLLPAIGDNNDFHQLRKNILMGIIKNPRSIEPHITLMHPRNASCTDSIFEEIEMTKFPSKITFKKISLIQQEMGEKWLVVRAFNLKKR